MTHGIPLGPLTRVQLVSSRSTHLAVLLVLAPHLLAQASGRLAGLVRGHDVVMDQGRQVSAHRGQVSAVGQPWGDGRWCSDTDTTAQSGKENALTLLHAETKLC